MAGLAGAPEGAKVIFLTLTSLPGADWRKLMKSWTQLVAGLRRRHMVGDYVCRKEEGSQTGMKHLHVLLISPRGRLPYREIVQSWSRMTGAYIAWLRDTGIDRKHYILGRYLAKYLGKGTDGDARVWRKEITYSTGWPKVAGPVTRVLETWKAAAPLTAWGAGAWWTAAGLMVQAAGFHGCECFGRILEVDWPLT